MVLLQVDFLLDISTQLVRRKDGYQPSSKVVVQQRTKLIMNPEGLEPHDQRTLWMTKIWLNSNHAKN